MSSSNASSKARDSGNSMPRTKTKLTTRQRESKKISRKRAVRRWWQVTTRRLIIVSALAITVSFAAGGWWFWHSGKLDQFASAIHGSAWNQTAKLGFRVEHVYLEGRKYTAMDDISRAMEVKPGDPILALSLSDMRARLQAIPRVKYAEVARVLPDQLHIRVIEREPIALWQNNGKLYLIDEDGVVMNYVDPKQFGNLFLVVGDGAPAHTRELLGVLASEPELYKDISAALRIGERRWTLRFKNGVELKLPEEKADVAWQNFARMNREQHLLDRAIKSVDMRTADRIFIKLAPGEAKPIKGAGSGSET